jgi:hypothetical protein
VRLGRPYFGGDADGCSFLAGTGYYGAATGDRGATFMSPIRLLTPLLFCLFMALPSVAQDIITVGSVAGRAGTRVSVPVWVRDTSGTTLGADADATAAIQALAFRVRIYPAASATDVTFVRDGITGALVPLYERAIAATDSIAYIATFSDPIPLVTDAAAPGARVGTLSLTIAEDMNPGTTLTLTLDAETTALSNRDGALTETVTNSRLILGSGVVIVGGSPTTLTLTSSMNPSVSGQDVTITARVTSTTAGSIGGRITFFTNGVETNDVEAVNGTASFATAALPVGTHSITASYEGSGPYQPSASTALNQTVNTNEVASPGGIVATAVGPTQVNVTWQPVANAASYEILRRSVLNGGDTIVGTSAATSFSDISALPGKTFVYAVRALTSANVRSAAGAFDPATTVTFTDQTLVGLVVKRVHLTELRAAANEYRRAAGLQAYPFTEEPLPNGATTKKVHIEEVRTAVNEARARFGLTAQPFTNPFLVALAPVRTVHFDELRNSVK